MYEVNKAEPLLSKNNNKQEKNSTKALKHSLFGAHLSY